MAGRFNNFMFSVPNLPKPVYTALKAIADKLDLSHQQVVILGVAAIMTLSRTDKAALGDLVSKMNDEAVLDMSHLDS